jgi:hypothetical protein
VIGNRPDRSLRLGDRPGAVEEQDDDVREHSGGERFQQHLDRQRLRFPLDARERLELRPSGVLDTVGGVGERDDRGDLSHIRCNEVAHDDKRVDPIESTERGRIHRDHVALRHDAIDVRGERPPDRRRFEDPAARPAYCSIGPFGSAGGRDGNSSEG